MVARRILVTAIVSFILFSAEAMLHFFIGKGEAKFPSLEELAQILGTVLLFSLLSAGISNYLNYYVLPPARPLGKHPLKDC